MRPDFAALRERRERFAAEIREKLAAGGLPVAIRPNHAVYLLCAVDSKTGGGLYKFRNERMGGTKYYIIDLDGTAHCHGAGKPKAVGVWRRVE